MVTIMIAYSEVAHGNQNITEALKRWHSTETISFLMRSVETVTIEGNLLTEHRHFS